MNVVLFDHYVVAMLQDLFGPIPVLALSLLGASLNVIVAGLLVALFWQATAGSSSSAKTTSDSTT